MKNTEGYDRIPQRILVDGVDLLLESFVGLFLRIYNQTDVPAQWLISKTIPIYKSKGDKTDIESQIMGTRQKKFSINMTNSKKVGMNALSNRLWYLNGKIDTDWLNLSFDTFKVNCKKLLLQ